MEESYEWRATKIAAWLYFVCAVGALTAVMVAPTTPWVCLPMFGSAFVEFMDKNRGRTVRLDHRGVTLTSQDAPGRRHTVWNVAWWEIAGLESDSKRLTLRSTLGAKRRLRRAIRLFGEWDRFDSLAARIAERRPAG